jgi:glutamate carboxypeptidase
MIWQIIQEIDRLGPRYAQVWEDVCNIESPSAFKEGVDRVGRYFMDLARAKGWEVEVFPQERFGDSILITMNPNAPGVPVALSGHMDTVHPVGSFGNPPARREGNVLYGPGAMDCKGGVVAGFLAMEALARCGYEARPVMMLLQSNEEVGSGIQNKDSIRWICQKAKGAAAFLNLEGHESEYAGKATLIRKGIAGFRLQITGIEAHASYCVKEGASAVLEAAHKIIAIEAMKEQNGITCNCGIVKGGTVTNSVPGNCEIRVDVRFPTQADLARATAFLQEIADRVYVPGCSCVMEQTNLRPAMEFTEDNLALLKRANELFRGCGLSELEIGQRTGGSDAADVTLFGIPCMDSIGAGGDRGHSPEERGYIDSLYESAKRVAAIVYGL